MRSPSSEAEVRGGALQRSQSSPSTVPMVSIFTFYGQVSNGLNLHLLRPLDKRAPLANLVLDGQKHRLGLREQPRTGRAFASRAQITGGPKCPKICRRSP